MSETPNAPPQVPPALAVALAQVEARLSTAEAAIAAGAEIPLDDLEHCVDALCQDSVRVDDAARAAARMTLEALLVRLNTLEAAIAAKAAP